MSAKSMTGPRAVTISSVATEERPASLSVELPDYDRERFDDVSFITAMTLVLLGNYSQTGHFGGPLAYTPYNVAAHLAGPEAGGLRYDIRQPKLPFSDKFMVAGGHNIPTGYALWMILYEAMAREHAATGDDRFAVDPDVAMLSIDALGFRRGAGALETLLADNGLAEHELFSQAKLRGIRSLAGHAETTDVTNDVNGGPSGIGIATAGGKAMFWDFVRAPESLKILALEGEFAMTEGHAQELKTAALAQKVGKRLRILLSYNNAGIDDSLVGGVIDSRFSSYDLIGQWVSYGWNVFHIDDGNDFDQVMAVLKAMEDWPQEDRRPMIVVGDTVKGWWPGAVDGKVNGQDQLVGYPSHPYAMKMNSEYFVSLARSFEQRYGVVFEGIDDGPVADERERLIQFKTNIDVALSVMDSKPGLREWIANKLLEIAEKVPADLPVRIPTDSDPFLDDRLRPPNLPMEPQTVSLEDPATGERVEGSVELFKKPGDVAGTRRAISEIGKWLNYVTDNRFLTVAADLSDSINIEHAHFLEHYDPDGSFAGTRIKAPIQEAVNASSVVGLVGQTVSADPEVHAGVWGLSGTYGAFTPLMYTPVRVFSQQNQDSPFNLGVLTVLAGHSGPETAADARTHFGIFAPQVWTLFPRGEVTNLYFWDYNDVAPGFFAAVEHSARHKESGLIVIHVARPDFPVADRSTFADSDVTAAAKGVYLLRDYDPDVEKMGNVFVQGSSSTVNLVKVLPQLEKEGVNVRVAAVISEDLFRLQPRSYQESILPDEVRYDSMFVTTMTKRVPQLANMGPLTEEYSLTADWDDRWRTGGSEADVIAESHLDANSILEGIRRFARERSDRLKRQRGALNAL